MNYAQRDDQSNSLFFVCDNTDRYVFAEIIHSSIIVCELLEVPFWS